MLEGPVLSYSSLFCGRLVGTSIIQSTMANFLHMWSILTYIIAMAMLKQVKTTMYTTPCSYRLATISHCRT